MKSVLVEGSESTKASKVEMNLNIGETVKGKCGWCVVRQRRAQVRGGWGQVLEKSWAGAPQGSCMIRVVPREPIFGVQEPWWLLSDDLCLLSFLLLLRELPQGPFLVLLA